MPKKARIRRKRILLSLAPLFLIYVSWLGYHALSFQRYASGPLSTESHEIEGVYHIHTIFSDGYGQIEKIAQTASDHGLDFIITTDHGSPNFESMETQGFLHGVLVLAGSEISVSRGHLVALDFELPEKSFSQNAELAAYKVHSLHGITVIAHPYSKVRWSWGKMNDYSGIELINGDSMSRQKIARLIPYLPLLAVKPSFFTVKTLLPPERNLLKWDQLNRDHVFYGYFATDAHLLYKQLLKYIRLHIPLDDPLSSDFKAAGQQVFDALRSGRFYNAVDGAAEARGFHFSAHKGAKAYPMGAKIRGKAPVTFRISAPFDFNFEIRLLHDGTSVAISAERVLSYETDQSGTYRVEVYLKERSPLNPAVPWIVSNPIFLRKAEQ